MNSWIISLLVNNHFGVLTRVTGLFSRRGYNIASLSVGETHNPELSRITIRTLTDVAGIHQVMKQLQKLEDVKKVCLLPGAETVAKELLLVKFIASPGKRDMLCQELEGFAYKIPYSDETKLIMEFAGTAAQCESLLSIISKYTILELCRTGITAMSTTSEIAE